MIVVRVEEVKPPDPDRFLWRGRAVVEPRGEGLHLSEITKYLAIVGKLAKEYEEEFELNWLMCTGLAWEDWMMRYVPNAIHQPGELERDGILATPDGWTRRVEWVDGETVNVVEECKATWMSAKGFDIRKAWEWWVRVGCYCELMGTTYGRFWVKFVNGGYEWFRGGKAVVRCYWVEFEEGETARLWAMVKQGKKRYLESLKGNGKGNANGRAT